jgi:hypothetical protein
MRGELQLQGDFTLLPFFSTSWNMRLGTLFAAAISLRFSGYVGAFISPTYNGRCSIALPSTVEPTTSDVVTGSNEDIDIPTNLPSEIGMDYVPLATMLATGQLEEADQFTRDALVVLAGSKNAGRNFVYFTEVKRIPSTDLATIERLWIKFSKGKFGYSVQKVSLAITFIHFSGLIMKLIFFVEKMETSKG